jgi:drug/metabolite transporter (DMT)-like permease
MFGEPVTAGIITWSAVAIAGVAIVVYGSSGAPVWSLTGDLLAIGALFAWTVYFVVSKRVRNELAPFEYLTAMLVIAAIAIAPLALLSGQRLDPGGAGEWGWIALLAIGSGGVGHLLLNWAHAHIDLSVMSLLTLAVPVAAVISAAIFLNESIEWLQVLGMAVVIAALGVVVLRTARSSIGEQGHGEALVAAE